MSSLRVLVTRSSPRLLHFTCFRTDTDTDTDLTVETCCQGIRQASAAWPNINNNNNNNNNTPLLLFLDRLDDCQSQMAEVPTQFWATTNTNTNVNVTLARYSWMLSYDTTNDNDSLSMEG
jgi:hypothetical protein